MKAYQQYKRMQHIGATRLRLGMSQQLFADAVGISRSHLSMVEAGKRTMPVLALAELAALEIRMAATATIEARENESTQHNPAITDQAENYILQLKAERCRMMAARKEADLAIIIARHQQYTLQLQQVDAMLNIRPDDNSNFHHNNLQILRFNIHQKMEKCSIRRQEALRHKIALLRAEAELYEIRAVSYELRAASCELRAMS